MSFANQLEIEMLALVNAERAQAGLNPLELNTVLNAAAETHSLWMLQQNIFSHTGVSGSSAGERMTDAGYTFSGSWQWAENLGWQSARGQAGYTDDVAQIHVALMNSPGHRANLLDPGLEEIGIGVEIGTFTAQGIDWPAVMITQKFATTDADTSAQLDPGVLPAAGEAPVENPVEDPAVDPDPSDGTAGQDGPVEDDSIPSGDGNDTVVGGADNDDPQPDGDTIHGGDGEDSLDGDDTIDDPIEPNIVSYEASTTGVIVNLATQTAIDGNGNTDTLIDIEEVRGGAGDDRIIGSDRSESFSGGAGADTFVAGDGDDTIIGGEGNDLSFAGAGDTGNDYFDGGLGRDVAFSGAGDDTLIGGAEGDLLGGGDGNDSLSGDDGSDTLWAGDGVDTVLGGAGNDIVGAGAGSDSVTAGAGDDLVYGGAGSGNDVISAGAGNDTVFGGGGADTLTGGAGDDALYGGEGDDTFLFAAAHGNDAIGGFANRGDNTIDLTALGVSGFGALSIDQVGGDTVIDTTEGTITLFNTNADDLTADHFLF